MSVFALGAFALGLSPASAAAPANVTGLTATATSPTSVTLNWTNPTSTGFKGVHICRNTGISPPTSSCAGVNVVSPTHTYADTHQLVANTLYTYSVFAYNTSAQLATGASVAVTTQQSPAPANVTALTATALSSTSIRLNWTNPPANSAGVYICRGYGTTAPTYPCGGVTVLAPMATYTDSNGLIPNTQYTYTVFSGNSAGVLASGTSVTVSTPNATPPPAPANVTGLTATALSSTSIQLNWTNPPSNFAGVYICRNIGTTAPTSPCGGFTDATLTGTYTDSNGLIPNTTYTYTVFAGNSSGVLASGASVTVSTPQSAAPANVTGLTATPTDTSVELDWTNPTSAGFAGVYICRNTGTTAPTYPCGGVIAAATTTYTDSNGLLPNTTYTYTVFAGNSSGVLASGTSVTVTTTP
jgi:hypothetical protein